MKYFEFFQEWLAESEQPFLVNNDLIIEGGAYGHLAHPFEDLDLTMKDLLEMIEATVKGSFSPENFAQEKTDGQNIMISWKDGRLIAARNKSHLKNFGSNALTKEALAKKFAGRGNIETAFNSAIADLESSIRSLSERDKIKFFDNGKKFASVEIITPLTQNVIPYGQNMLVFHGINTMDEDGNVIDEDKQAGRDIGKIIEDVNAHVQDMFFVRGPHDLEIKPLPNASKKLSYYKKELKRIMDDAGIGWGGNVWGYTMGMGIHVLHEVADKLGIKIPKEAELGVLERLLSISKDYTARDMKRDLGDDAYKKLLEYEKKNSTKFKRMVYEPLEHLFLELGTDIMKNMSAFLSANPTQASMDMKKEIEDTIKEIRINGDERDIQKLEDELKRMAAAGGIESIVPTEGITFVYKGKLYKYTGIFAPLNQIRGILKFKR